MDIIGFIASLFITKRRQAEVKAIAAAKVSESEGVWTPSWANAR